ncbi:MAG: hypothetical protein IJW20_05670 [Clostridia bacterium]|nr:hypothetical protein [Clostridia bacterium]
MEVDLLKFKKNIISWYPIEKKDTVLQVGEDVTIHQELLKKTNNVVVIEKIDEFEMKANFDYVTLIGSFENLQTEKEIVDLIAFAKSCLTRDGRILIAMKNKFGMKYWTGEKESENSEIFGNIVSKKENIFGIAKIKSILEDLKLKYKFYYPLPDYKTANVIFTDEYLPTNDSIDARDLTYCKDGELLVFSEREAYKQLLNEDKNQFPFFANSFFIEVAEKDRFQDIKYVGYGITRKEHHRIKTVIRKNIVEKTADNETAQEHIKNISRNIKVLNDAKIDCLDKFDNNMIISKFLPDAKSFDEVLIDIYNKKGLDEVIKNIKEFKKEILDNLLKEAAEKENTVFEKYNVEISNELKEKLHFTKNGILDLIFQNCLVKGNKIFAYDQEWYEENVPVEFILYRAIFYFTELKKRTDINEIYKKLELEEYVEAFEKLETILQGNIVDEGMWELHRNSTKSLGGSKNFVESYEARLDAANEHIKNLEALVNEYRNGIEDLNKLIREKDAGLEDYANQLRAISNSLSWKITKPIRTISNALRKNK